MVLKDSIHSFFTLRAEGGPFAAHQADKAAFGDDLDDVVSGDAGGRLAFGPLRPLVQPKDQPS